jgi:hypothetical protein
LIVEGDKKSLGFPSFSTMSGMPSGTILFLLKSRLFFAAKTCVMILGIWEHLTGNCIVVLTTVFLPTIPTPRLSTP